MKSKGRWYLRHYLAALLTLATVLTVVVVGSILLFERLPVLERQNSTLALHEARHFAQTERTLLRATENRLSLLAHAVELLPAERATAMLDAALLQDDTLRSVFVTSAAGRVTLAGLRPEDKSLRSDAIGSDLSGTPLFISFVAKGGTAWSAKYLSLLTGYVTVGVATGLKDGRVLVAEVPLSKLVRPLANPDAQTLPEVGSMCRPWWWMAMARCWPTPRPAVRLARSTWRSIR